MPASRSSRTAFRRSSIALVAAIALAVPRAAFADADADYKLHRDNGVKLFGDNNYKAAIAEFQAAYDAKPKASPLINIALCYKGMFNYPKAIATLERALAQHADTMTANDKKASEDSINEMRGLLAYVTVKVTPSEVSPTLVVDGEEQPAGAASKPVPLGPGPHTIGAKADGYALAEQSVTVASGAKSEMNLKLVANKGFLRVEARDARGTISIDGKQMGTGVWAGLLEPGPHDVSIVRPVLAPFSIRVMVKAGETQTIVPGVGNGIPSGPVGQPTPQPPKKDEPPVPPKKGFFVSAMASLVQPLVRPTGYPQARPNTGGLGGIRVGYRVNNPAAFDLMFQYANVYTGTDDSHFTGSGYTFSSFRFGAELRLMTPGKTVRFVGSLGGGFTLDKVTFDQKFIDDGVNRGCFGCQNGSGANAFVLGELGLEIDLSNVLLGAGLEGVYQSSRGVTPTDATAPVQQSGGIFGGDGIPWIGGGLRIGYAFW